MTSRFDYARGLLRASIADCFGRSIVVTTPEGAEQEINGYIRSAKRGNHTLYRLISNETLPEQCSTVHEGMPYLLVYEQPIKGNGTDSQISNEFVLMPQGEGANKNAWSEFPAHK